MLARLSPSASLSGFLAARSSLARYGAPVSSTRTASAVQTLSLLDGAMLVEELPTLSCLRTSHVVPSNGSVLDSLVARGETPHVAWRVSFVVVPFIIIMFMALVILFFAPDTPTGPWKDRHLNQPMRAHASGASTTPATTGQVVDVAGYGMEDGIKSSNVSGNDSAELEKGEDLTKSRTDATYDTSDIKFAEATLIKKPHPLDVLKIALSLPTLTNMACYFVSFGTELSFNSNLSAFYIAESRKPAWSQSLAGDWAAMYGLLNIVTRPLGGYIADSLYPLVGVEGKKYWMIFCMSI
jgi:NNP family nitrate/nitrite transporter-like MFS transporter